MVDLSGFFTLFLCPLDDALLVCFDRPEGLVEWLPHVALVLSLSLRYEFL